MVGTSPTMTALKVSAFIHERHAVTIEIVPIREEHIEGFHAVLDEVAREKRYLAFLEAPAIESTRQFVGRAIRGEFTQHVALDNGGVVGWCDVILRERETMRHGGALGIGIAPPYRDKGLGARLIGSVLAAARARGLSRVSLHVRADNARAIRLYERLGFQHEGRFRRDLRIDGVDHDSLAMAMLLDEAGPAAVEGATP
ncbi:MAG: GNAT family N-acetyltransferase [Hyphomicrobiaceae bacterium]|nr:GNAT family N-acetyltransferase [Hyphomicrobiaceae bacterium]